MTKAQLTHDSLSMCHTGHSVGLESQHWLSSDPQLMLGILTALEMLWLGEPAPFWHRLGEPAPVRAVQRCHAAVEGTEMGFNQASAVPGIGNLTHPKPVPVAAGAEDRHCPAGC